MSLLETSEGRADANMHLERPAFRTCSWPIMIAVIAAACAATGSDAPSMARAQIVQVGETLVVRNVGVDTGEEIRLTRDWGLGSATGARYEELGKWIAVHPTHDGGFVLSERTPTRVRLMDSLGIEVRSYGKRGSGPGEYIAPSASIMDSRGFLYLRRVPIGLNVYDQAGAFIRGWTTPASPGSQWHIDPRGFVSQLVQDDYTNLYSAILMDGNGRVIDTIPAPVPYGDSLTVRFAREGGAREILVVPLSPRFHLSYGFLGFAYGNSAHNVVNIRTAAGRLTRIESDARRIEASSGERGSLASMATDEMRAAGSTTTLSQGEIPGSKPFYKRIMQTSDGYLWLELHQPAARAKVTLCPPSREITAAPSGTNTCDDGLPPRPMHVWVEPLVFDVFDSVGVFRGRVRIPKGLELVATRGKYVFLLERDELDVSTLWRYSVLFRDTPADPTSDKSRIKPNEGGPG